jgi:type IV secretion system protein VirD4
MSSDNRSSIGAWLGLLFGALVVGAFWLLWLAGQLSSVFSGRGWPDSSPSDAVNLMSALIHNPGDLAQAWPAEAAVLLGTTRQIYLIFGVLLVLALGFSALLVWAGLAWRRRRGFRWGRLGFASGWEIRRLIGYRAVLKRAATTRPALSKSDEISPLDVGYYLGRDVRSRRRVYSSVEDPMLVVGTSAKGKDSQFITPFMIDAPGAVVVLTSQLETFTTTYAARAQLGSVYVFDPDNILSWPDRTKLNLVLGARTPTVADDMATDLANYAGYHMGGARDNAHDASYFSATAAVIILRCYLHAAALHGRNMIDVVRWTRDPLDPEPVALLRQAEAAGVAAHGWAAELEGLTRTDQEARTAMWATASQCLRFLHNREILEQFSPGPDEVFDVPSFVSGRNTLYLLAKDKGDHPITPGMHILLQSIWARAMGVANQSPNRRLEPPLTVEINEADSIMPMATMPRFMYLTAKGSIATHVYVRSLSHMKHRFGEKPTRNLWDAAQYRVILGGGGNVDDLAELSRLVGDVRRPPGLTDAGHEDDINPILTVEDLRTMKFGRAVVVARSARPVEIKLTPWWKRRDGEAIAAAKRDMEQRIEDLARHAPPDTRVEDYIRSQSTLRPLAQATPIAHEAPTAPLTLAAQPAPTAPLTPAAQAAPDAQGTPTAPSTPAAQATPATRATLLRPP